MSVEGGESLKAVQRETWLEKSIREIENAIEDTERELRYAEKQLGKCEEALASQSGELSRLRCDLADAQMCKESWKPVDF